MRLKPVFADMGVSPARVNGVALSPIQEDMTEDYAAELDSSGACN